MVSALKKTAPTPFCRRNTLDRHKCLLFTQAKTLFSFLVPGVGNTEIRDFGRLFRSNGTIALAAEGVPAQYIQNMKYERSLCRSCRDNLKGGGYMDTGFARLKCRSVWLLTLALFGLICLP